MQMDSETLYKVFYVHRGKYFLTPSYLTDGPKVAITRKHPNFKNEVGWFTFSQAEHLIKDTSFTTVWGICDSTGKQWVAGKFDRVLRMK
jgi:hypothetical protein